MQLHSKQKEIIISPKRFKVIRGGRRSGKTSLLIEDMAFIAVSKKGNDVIYLAPTQIQSRSIIWEALKSRLSQIAEINESRLEMKVPTMDGGTSLITVAGWENRENFRGRKVKKIYFDELDTMKHFFISWQEIFRPALTDLKGGGMFCGTPKKENPNLKRLEKIAETDNDWESFHLTTYDNPAIDKTEIDKAKLELDFTTFKQEYLAEYVENQGALFSFSALVDVFTNTVSKTGGKYLIVDVADEGDDKTIFSFWDGLEEYEREEYSGINTEMIIQKIREEASKHKIPYSQIAVDAIGIGAGIASNSSLNGIIGFKSSFTPIKTDLNIILPNVSYTKDAKLTSDFRNLRSQCIFTLANLVNNHKIASKVTGAFKEKIIEELSNYQDSSQGDGKRMATPKEEVKLSIGRSPDHSDCFIMRMYFEIMSKIDPNNPLQRTETNTLQAQRFMRNMRGMEQRSNK